jgi:hypothetical protein
MKMDTTKGIKVHDIVWVNLNPLWATDGQTGYAEVLNIEEDKTEGITYYDVRFRGSDDIIYDVEDFCVYPITSTGDVLPNGSFDVIFVVDKAEDAKTTQQDKEDTMHDKHYRNAVVEPILVMQALFNHDELVGFLKGNILKYRLRLGHKGTEEDMKADYDKLCVYEMWLDTIKNGERIEL